MWEKLLAHLGENPEASALVKTLRETQDTLTDRVTHLEKESTQAFTKRDNAIGELAKVKELLGVSEVNEETIKALKKGDSSAEVENLTAQLKELSDAKGALEADYSNYKQSTSMDKAFTQAGIEAKAANPKTLDIIKSLLKEGSSVLEDGTIGYKNPDGTTMYHDGRPVTITDRVAQISSDEAYFGLFKGETPSGGGSNPSKPGGQVPTGDKANFGGDTSSRQSAVKNMLERDK